jgi:hypothetical protein
MLFSPRFKYGFIEAGSGNIVEYEGMQGADGVLAIGIGVVSNSRISSLLAAFLSTIGIDGLTEVAFRRFHFISLSNAWILGNIIPSYHIHNPRLIQQNGQWKMRGKELKKGKMIAFLIKYYGPKCAQFNNNNYDLCVNNANLLPFIYANVGRRNGHPTSLKVIRQSIFLLIKSIFGYWKMEIG